MKKHVVLMVILACLLNIVNAQWQQTNGLSGGNYFGTGGDEINCFIQSGSNILAGSHGGVYISSDNGSNWSAIGSVPFHIVYTFVANGSNIYAGTDYGIYLSSNNGYSWSQLYPNPVATLLISGNNIFAGSNGSGGVLLSSNNGSSWIAVNTGLTNPQVRALAQNGSSIFAGTWGGGMFMSTNNGNIWTAVNTGLTNDSICTIVVNGNNIFAGTYNNGLFMSTNNGSNWVNLFTNRDVTSLAISGNNIFAGINGCEGIKMSLNNGGTWVEMSSGLINTYVWSLDIIDSTLFAGTYGGGAFIRPLSDFNGRIIGNFTYDNINSTPLDSLWVFLMWQGFKLDSIQSDINGQYQFNNVPDGTYNINTTTHKIWSGVNSTDAVLVNRHFVGSQLLTSSILLHSADVNLSYGINTTDAVKITRRFLGLDHFFTRGDWVFEKPLGGDTINVSVGMNDTFIVSGNSVTQNFKGLCVGDVNGSNIPPAKLSSKVQLDILDLIKLNSNNSFAIPIIATNNIIVGAISIILKFPNELVTIDNVQLSTMYDNSNLLYNIQGDEIRIGWYENEVALSLKNNEPVIIITGKTTNKFKEGDVIKFSISNNPLCEFADESGNPIDNVVLKTYSIVYSDGQYIESFESALNNDMFIILNNG